MNGFPLLLRAGLRHLARHPWQAGLAVVGVALGVAVVVSVGLANASASRAFDLSTEAITGRATHQVVGGPGGLPEEVYPRLTVEHGITAAAPVVVGSVTVAGATVTSVEGAGPGAQDSGRTLRLLGVDPFAERPFRAYLQVFGLGGGTVDLAAFLTRPGAALASPDTAAELGARVGDRLPLVGGGAVELVGLLDPAAATTRAALDGLLVTDLATAQELTGGLGTLSRIDLIVPEGAAGEALLARVREALPAGARVLPAAARSRASEQMTRAFRLNLRALSLLALICGAFLIYNTMTFSVVQRRPLIGRLRALGVTRGQVLALVLGEAALVGAAGTALGLAGGAALGRALVGLVSRTINDLYFALEVRTLALPAATLAEGAALGLAATLLAALGPAREATTAPPRAVLLRSEVEHGSRRGVPRSAAAGLLLAAAGAVLLVVGRGLLTSFAGLFAVLVGFALLTPAVTVLMMALAGPPMGRLAGVLGRMAARGVVAALSRTAVALAALALAVAVTVGVGVMVDSFRGTVERWLGSTLQADLYLAPAGGSRAFDEALLTPEDRHRVAALPGVAYVGSVRRAELEAAGESGEVVLTRLLALDIDARSYPGLELRQGEPEEVWPAFQEREAAVVSEVFAWRRGVGVGDRLALPTDRGERSFEVAGVYTDYASDRGIVLLARRTWERYWDDPRISGLSVFVEEGVPPDEVAAAVRGLGGLEVSSNRALREASLAVFDRTFKITSVLRLLVGVVAFIGVVSALLALELERARELGVLRANGLTPGQVWQLVTAQTGLMGLAAGILSLPLGLLLGAVMIYIVNRRSFGWTLSMEVAPAVLLEALALALAAALLAGLYPAWKMARTPPAAALRGE